MTFLVLSILCYDFNCVVDVLIKIFRNSILIVRFVEIGELVYRHSDDFEDRPLLKGMISDWFFSFQP